MQMMTRPAPALSSSAVPVKTMLAEVRKPLGPVWWSVFLASVLLAAWGEFFVFQHFADSVDFVIYGL